MRTRLSLYWELARPFTLIAPALGMISGGITALGAGDPIPISGELVLKIILGAMMAAALNGASNGINQIYDLTADRINKPKRPIPSGRMSVREAAWVSLAMYVAAGLLAALVNRQCFVLAFAAAVATVIYSVPPFRAKRHGVAANITIAIPRGVLLRVAGWSAVRPDVFTADPAKHAGEAWFVGAIFGVFLLGAATTKDFADMKGDAEDGCETLPIRYGPRAAAWMISPFFIIPFLLIPLGTYRGWLSGSPVLLYALGFGLALWGAYTVYLILRDPEELARTENHPSWRQMYLMMFALQIGFVVSYLAKYWINR